MAGPSCLCVCFKTHRTRPDTMRAPWVLALAAVLLMPSVQAGISLPARSFHGEAPFIDVDAVDIVSVLSGQFTGTSNADGHAQGYLNLTRSVEVTGLERVCWAVDPNSCVRDPAGGIRIVIASGSSFGFRAADAFSSEFEAKGATGSFVDLSGVGDATLHLGPSLVASVTGAVVTLDPPPIPLTADLAIREDGSNVGVFLALEGRPMGVYEGASTSPVYTVDGVDEPFVVQGDHIEVTAIMPGTIVMSFDAGSDLVAKPAKGTPPSVSSLTTTMDRLKGVVGDESASEDGSGGGSNDDKADLGPLAGFADTLFNGAYVQLAVRNKNPDIANMTFVHFSKLTAEASSSGVVRLEGKAAIIAEEGEVAGAQSLVGFSFIKVPWWSIVLWILAIAAFIVRLTRKEKAPKDHFKWDKYRWIGIVSGIVATILVFLLWDNEINGAFGTSILHGAKGGGLAFIGLVEMLPFALFSLLAQRPLKILIGNCTRIGKQGRFMGLNAPVAIILGYFLTAPLLLSYLELALKAAT